MRPLIPMLFEVDSVRDTITGARATAFSLEVCKTIICMVVPHGSVAPLTAIAIFIRPALEDGEGDELKTGCRLGLGGKTWGKLQ
jgi:hypothetical protein